MNESFISLSTFGETEATLHRSKRKRDKGLKNEENNLTRVNFQYSTNGTPWIVRQYSDGVLGLHEDIEDFYEWMVPTAAEHLNRLETVRRIQEAVLESWPNAKIEIFGSFRTGLYLPTSDIDLVIIGPWHDPPLRCIERLLVEKEIARSYDVKVLEFASVPIVKLKDSRTGINVDICFNAVNGVRTAEFIKYYKRHFPLLPQLIYVLKQFLLQRDLNEVFTGGLSSYSLILLVISFFQLHPRKEASSNRANLAVLLLEFLELYGRNFNYLQTAIRITNGGSYIPKNEFYKSMRFDGFRPGMLTIEDPLNVFNDVSRNSYGFINVQRTFARAYIVLSSVISLPLLSHRSYLNSILFVSQNVTNFRHWISQTYRPYLYNIITPTTNVSSILKPVRYYSDNNNLFGNHQSSSKSNQSLCSLPETSESENGISPSSSSNNRTQDSLYPGANNNNNNNNKSSKNIRTNDTRYENNSKTKLISVTMKKKSSSSKDDLNEDQFSFSPNHIRSSVSSVHGDTLNNNNNTQFNSLKTQHQPPTTKKRKKIYKNIHSSSSPSEFKSQLSESSRRSTIRLQEPSSLIFSSQLGQSKPNR